MCLRLAQGPHPANSTAWPALDPRNTHTEGWVHPSENRPRKRPTGVHSGLGAREWGRPGDLENGLEVRILEPERSL